jgi:LytS/YehU family sensor histidine kinase
MAEEGKIELLFPFIYEMTGAFSFALLLPVMLYLYKKYPLTKHNFVVRIIIYFAVAVPLGIIHTYLMYCSRQVIFAAAGFGEYNYGYMPYRFIMEYIKMCMGFAVAYVVFYSIRTLKEKEEEKLRRSLLEEHLTKARLEALKSRLNPHFLFNTLNMISSVMYEDIAAADKMIANLSELLRESLKTSGKGIHKLDKEIELLNLYKEIMAARFYNKLEMNVNIILNPANAAVPVFLFQPIVENSVKHCMNSNGKIIIDVTVSKTGERLIITIVDNGPGISKNDEDVLNSGVGLKNTYERLKNLYNDDFNLSWENLPGRQSDAGNGGLKVIISIPYEETNNE